MSKHTQEEDQKEQNAEAGTGNVQADTEGQSASGGGTEAVKEQGEKSPEEKIAILENQLIEANDQYLRKAADFENYRKRIIREKQEAVDYANQSLLLDLIDIMDDFDRAIKAAEDCLPKEGQDSAAPDQVPASVFKTFYEGVSMIKKRFSSQLENKWGLKRFDSEGQPFDHNRHEAIMMDKSPDVSEPLVKEEFYKGYILKDRVVRSAKVKVLMPGPKEDKAQDSGNSENAGSAAAN